MDTILNTPARYTLISVTGFAVTTRQEITLNSYDEARGVYLLNIEGKKGLHTIPPQKIDDALLFEGHQLPLMADSDTDSFICGGSEFNLISDHPEALKAFIEQHCLNLTPYKKSLIYYAPTATKETVDPEYQPLFPEA